MTQTNKKYLGVCLEAVESFNAFRDSLNVHTANMRQRQLEELRVFLEAWSGNAIRYSNKELEGVLPVFELWYEFMVRFVGIAKEHDFSVCIDIDFPTEGFFCNVHIYFLKLNSPQDSIPDDMDEKRLFKLKATFNNETFECMSPLNPGSPDSRFSCASFRYRYIHPEKSTEGVFQIIEAIIQKAS